MTDHRDRVPNLSMLDDGRLNTRTRRLVVVLVFGSVLPLLDSSIVNIALNELAGAFHTTIPVIQWTVTGYALASAVAIPISGWATRRFGGKPVWVTALAVFLIGSVLCGFAWNPTSLIVFRLLQGFGGGLSLPVMQTLLISSAGRDQATRAMTAIGIPAVIAPVIAPFLGGLLLDTIGWRWIFWINAPICLTGILLAVFFIPPGNPDKSHRLDLLGFATLCPALTLGVFALSGTATASPHMTLRVWLPLGLALAFLAVYIGHTLHHTNPLVDFRLFRRPAFTGAFSALILASITFYGGLLLLPLYYQHEWGLSALQTGALLALQGVGAYLARTAANKLTSTIGTRNTVLTFLTLAIIGTLPFALLPNHSITSSVILAVALIVRGGGIGALTVLTMSAVYHRATPSEVSHASTASRIATQLGGALGATIFAAILSTSSTTTTFWWLTGITALILPAAALLPTGKIQRA